MGITHSESYKGPNPLTRDALAGLKHGQALFVLLAERLGDGPPRGWQVFQITPTLLRHAMAARTDARAYRRILDAAAGVALASKGSGRLARRFTTEQKALDWLSRMDGTDGQFRPLYVRVRPKQPTHGSKSRELLQDTYPVVQPRKPR